MQQQNCHAVVKKANRKNGNGKIDEVDESEVFVSRVVCAAVAHH